LRIIKSGLDPEVISLLSGIGHQEETIRTFVDELRAAKCRSIDAFLETRNDLMAVGKALIAYFLISREDPRGLYHDGNKDDWYEYLIDNLLVSPTLESFGDNSLTIVNFNYDRSLEYTLLSALMARYNCTEAESAAQLRRIPIIYLHGNLGGAVIETTSRRYRAELNDASLIAARDGIRIIHEEPALDGQFVRAREAIDACERLVFLGFGYHPKNVERLQLEASGDRRILGTAVGMTIAEQDQAKSLFPGARIDLYEWNNLRFLRESLSAF
jgi:hypothetical protein